MGWLSALPDLVPNYSDLDETIRKTHRYGVGQLLRELDKERYENIRAEQVIQGIYNGLFANERYELFPSVFLMHEQNLRKDTLERIFTSAGVTNCWSWVENYRGMERFIQDVRGDNNTAEAELKAFVLYRNEASHSGEVEQLLSANGLLEIADFVEILCVSLAELLTYKILIHREKRGEVRLIGEIRESFRSGAVVAVINNASVSIGSELFFEGKSWCCQTVVTSIRLNDISHDSIEIQDAIEVGFKFNLAGKVKLRLWQEIL